jgi:hypothetical protein
MNQIHVFVDGYDQAGKSHQELAFQNTLRGYLQLIEDDADHRKKQTAEAPSKKGKALSKKVVKKISPDLFHQVKLHLSRKVFGKIECSDQFYECPV